MKHLRENHLVVISAETRKKELLVLRSMKTVSSSSIAPSTIKDLECAVSYAASQQTCEQGCGLHPC